MDPAKKIKIQTGVVKRLFKELHLYEKELETEVAKLVAMKQDKKDKHDIAQQGRVVAESEMMIPSTRRRLEDGYEKLTSIVDGLGVLAATPEAEEATEVLKQVAPLFTGE